MERSPAAELPATLAPHRGATGTSALAPRAAARYPSPVPTYAAGCPRPVHRAVLCASAIVAFAHLPLASVAAQRLFGSGADASVLKRGQARWTIGGEWSVYDELLDATGNRRPLGGRFTNNLGAASIGSLAASELGVRATLQDNTVSVSAGQLRLREEIQRTLVPFSLEVGVTSRLTMSLVVPISLTYVSAVADLNRANPSPANVALNPAFTVIAAALQATNVQTQATAAVASIRALYPACFAAGAPASCAPTVLLASNVGNLGAGVETTYGQGSRFAPIAGSALHTQVLARFTSLNAQLRSALGVASDPITARPLPASVRMTINDLNTFLFASAYGINADTLTSLERTALGDVAIGARYLWANGMALVPAESGRARAALRFRSAAFVTLRLPTAPPPYLGQLLDPGSGDAATAIEWRSSTDVAAGENFWISVTGRYGMLIGDRVKRRLPITSGEIFIPSNQLAELERKLGDYAEFEMTPRWMFNDYFALSADYVLFMRRGDRYSGASSTGGVPIPAIFPGPVFPDAALLNTGHQTAQRVGIGFSYSTVASVARGKAGTPLEIRYQRLQTVGGEGTPFSTQDRLEFRIYTNLFGRH